jgi:hypothetical protein
VPTAGAVAASPSAATPASGAVAQTAPAADGPAKSGAATTPAPSPARDTTPATAGEWPADWREKLAGGDEKKLNALRRYATPQAYADAGFQLRQMMDSRQLKAPLAADAAPDAVAKWRAENGIPQQAAGYLAKLDRGLVAGEAEQRLIAPFLAAMLAKNAPPDTVNAALGAWRQIREQVQTAQLDHDARATEAAAETLRPEWGGAYQRNLNMIAGYLDTAPPGVKDNPAATVVPGSSGTTQATLAGRIAEIETLMRDNRPEYNRNTAMQQELLKLYAARDKQA